MDPHWFGSPGPDLQRVKKTGSGSALKLMRIHNTAFLCTGAIREFLGPVFYKHVSVSDPDPGEQPGSYFRELIKQFLGLKYLNSLLQIRDGKISDPGSGM
jgi:hypothetical protein